MPLLHSFDAEFEGEEYAVEIHREWIPHMQNWGYVVKSDKPLPDKVNRVIVEALTKAVMGRRPN